MHIWKNRAAHVCRTVYLIAVTASIWIAMAGTALAKYKDPDAAENMAPGEKGYSLQYVLVLLCIAMGMVGVCRATRRENESKLTKQDDEL